MQHFFLKTCHSELGKPNEFFHHSHTKTICTMMVWKKENFMAHIYW